MTVMIKSTDLVPAPVARKSRFAETLSHARHVISENPVTGLSFALLLVLFVAVTTFYFHNFWDMTGADRINNMIHALKNLSLIGGLLVIAGYPRRVVLEDDRYTSGV